MKNQKLTKNSIVEGEEQATGEVEVSTREEVIKEEEVADSTIATIVIGVATAGIDIEKTARRSNLGMKTHPKNLLQAVRGVRRIKKIKEKAQ